MEKDVIINHIISMKDEKEYLKSKINALIKWWIPFGLVQIQCRWIENFVTYRFGNEMNCYEKLSFNEKPSPLLLL